MDRSELLHQPITRLQSDLGCYKIPVFNYPYYRLNQLEKLAAMTTFQHSRFSRWVLVVGAGFAMFAVMSGAFAAHGLKHVLNAYHLGIFETAVRYQMYHAIALLIVGVISIIPQFSLRWLKFAAFGFILGIALFSGSLYLLALSGIKWLGAITPLGGVAFIFGWMALIVAALKYSPKITQ
jgi:uncharacterized membrane protein YgdD (TMEM256/DUF423 family)